MSKQTGEKVNMTISVDYYFKKGMELLAMRKGRPMSALLQEASEEKHPEIIQQKQKVVRRTIG
jgi:hypothetical protein